MDLEWNRMGLADMISPIVKRMQVVSNVFARECKFVDSHVTY